MILRIQCRLFVHFSADPRKDNVNSCLIFLKVYNFLTDGHERPMFKCLPLRREFALVVCHRNEGNPAMSTISGVRQNRK